MADPEASAAGTRQPVIVRDIDLSQYSEAESCRCLAVL